MIRKHLCAVASLACAAFSAQYATAMHNETCMIMQLESMNVYYFCYDEAIVTKKPNFGVKICRRTMLDYLRQLRKTSCADNERPKKIVKTAVLCAKGEHNAPKSYNSTFSKCQPTLADVFASARPKDGSVAPNEQSPESDEMEQESERTPMHFFYICGDEQLTCISTVGDCRPQVCSDGTNPILEGPVDPNTLSAENDQSLAESENTPMHFFYICSDKELTCTSTVGDCRPQVCDDGTMPILEHGKTRFLRGNIKGMV